MKFQFILEFEILRTAFICNYFSVRFRAKIGRSFFIEKCALSRDFSPSSPFAAKSDVIFNPFFLEKKLRFWLKKIILIFLR